MNKYIPSINGLRAISILLVVLSHTGDRDFGIPTPGGRVGVDIFFIISGYLITYLLLQEEIVDGTISLRNFYIRRTLRIFPVYYFILLVYFVMQLFGVLSFTGTSWLTSITYTKNFPDANSFDYETAHFWSLAAEEQFYLIWPFIFLYAKKFRIPFAIVVIASVMMVRIFSNIWIFNILTRGDAIMIGCLFAIFSQKISAYINAKKNKLVLIIPFILFLFLISLKRIFHIPDNANETQKAIQSIAAVISNLCAGLILLISINLKNNLWFGFLNNKIMNYIGKLSYSIYIWQQLFFSEKVGFFSKFPMNLIFIFVVANISYHFIEKPFLKMKDRFIKRVPTTG